MTRSPHKDAHPRLTRKGAGAALRSFGLVWLALIALLLLSCGLAYVPLGSWNLTVGIVIALTKAGLVVAFFMGLEKSSGLDRLAIGTGILFLVVLFTFTFSDLFTRL
jgi:cytochrome c oxidase subunit 4